ncbi:hypothetical protein [Rhizobium sp. TRM95796]|uniref:hypothetical protein n=1 Tax=Rhizobium sp. TRM95796 TaxID=2979862 RepID=UPI0021E98A04|nr:hypothetical protein [Rhizobium sp. TRM95796]MCV3765146.1 hypothetical protein [Rhizobium sp. TRM95796]
MTKFKEPFFRVKLSDQLIESMTLAALEAYVLGDQRNKKNKEKIETLGYIWGFRRIEGETVNLYLDRMSLSLSARRTNGSVTPHEHAAELKHNLIERWSPHLLLLGDFHTHPFDDLTEVKSNSGWDFSQADLDYLDGDEFLWEKSDQTPVNLVMTVCRLGRVRETFSAEMCDQNLWQFDAGEFRFWLNVNVGFVNRDGDRRQTFKDKSGVFLDLNTRFYNMPGDRIASHILRDA